MKFYLRALFYLSHLVCFNSQRDEILLEKAIMKLPARGEFQFPTGWNSTKWRELPSSPEKCFNSQRDEILPSGWQTRIFPRHWFQFPTGWNSTEKIGLNDAAKSIVSIPNGMKFYEDRGYKYGHSWFQFPTGWNSTICTRFSSSSSCCFNSQRDEILLQRKTLLIRI